MTTTSPTLSSVGERRGPLLAGRVLSGIVLAFLLLDGAMKLPPLQPVTEAMTALGWSGDPAVARSLGIVILTIAALYAWPPTATLGAVLLTAYLGGAIATHARIGSPLLTHTLFGVYLGLLAWAGLWLRDPELRRLMPVRGVDRTSRTPRT